MKCLVYQYWNGKILPGPIASRNNIGNYCERIGVDHTFDNNPLWAKNNHSGLSKPLHYDCFIPVFDSKYDEYDYILFLDADIFAVEGMKDNIFADFIESGCDIGMAVEKGQSKERMLNLKKNNSHINEKKFEQLVKSLGGDLPKDKDGYNKVYNSGVVLYSRNGIEKFRNNFMDFKEYETLAKKNGLQNVYLTDQNYLHAMVFSNNIDFYEIPNEWNTILRMNPDGKTVNDLRTENTKFVHIQFKAFDHRSKDLHNRITNLPISEWGEEWKRYSA